MDACGVVFAPEFVMMDADKAQFNACVTELPHTTVLMCWFHVTQNVWKPAQEFKVNADDTRSVFVDMYDMHYASEQEFPTVKTRVLTKWSSFARGSPARKLTDHITKLWVNSLRFSRWQAFHTPSGYAATNNPLEQYHRTLKVQCPGGKANPSDLIRNLDGARLATLNSDEQFTSVATASERLMRLYRLTCNRGCFLVHQLPPVGSVAADLYRVQQSGLRLTAAEKKLVSDSIRSVNARRMQTEGMPSGGWVVDTRSKSCSCAYNRKHGLCCHVIAACIQGGVACPGVSMRTRQFVRPNHVRVEAQDSPSTTSSDDGEPSDDEFVDSILDTDSHGTEGSDDGGGAQETPASPALSTSSLAPTEIFDEEGEADVLQVAGSSPDLFHAQTEAEDVAEERPATLPGPGGAQSVASPDTVADSGVQDPLAPRRSLRQRKPTKRAVESRLQRGKRSRC